LLCETLLEWEAFLKLDRLELKHVKRLKKKHQYIMFLIKKICKRTEGMGMKIMKFHGILHLMQDIINLGVPNCIDTGANESHHKTTKVAAKLTQRDIAVFEKQTAKRLQEFSLLDLAMAEIEGKYVWEYFVLDQDRGEVEPEEDPGFSDLVVTGGAQIRVFWDTEANKPSWKFPRSPKVSCGWKGGIVEWLYSLQVQVQAHGVQSPLDIRTEHKRNGQIFRGHPNFRKRGQWNDWALLDWGDYGHLPGEIWCFVDLTAVPPGFSMDFGGVRVESGIFAIVESSSFDIDANGQPNITSDLFTPILKEVELANNNGEIGRRFYLADVEAIVDPLCVIPDVGDETLRYFVVKPRKEWSNLFIQWVESNHKEDMDEMMDDEGSDD